MAWKRAPAARTRNPAPPGHSSPAHTARYAVRSRFAEVTPHSYRRPRNVTLMRPLVRSMAIRARSPGVDTSSR
jgi:hypothetical protein